MEKSVIRGRTIINKNRIITGFALLVTAVVLAAFFLPRYLNSKQASYPILTAKHDIPRGKNISSEDISVSKTLDKTLSSMGYSNPESVIGRVATRDLSAGCFVLQGDAAAEFTLPTIYDSIPEGFLLISISAPSLAGSVGGQIRANDIIRLYALDDNGTAVTPPELQYVKVLAVYNSQGIELNGSDTAYNAASASRFDTSDSASNGIIPSSITQSTTGNQKKHESPSLISLLVTQEQALRLIELEMSGRHYISLVSRNQDSGESNYLEFQKKVLDDMTRGKKG